MRIIISLKAIMIKTIKDNLLSCKDLWVHFYQSMMTIYIINNSHKDHYHQINKISSSILIFYHWQILITQITRDKCSIIIINRIHYSIKIMIFYSWKMKKNTNKDKHKNPNYTCNSHNDSNTITNKKPPI